MSASTRVSSAPSLSRPQPAVDTRVAERTFPVPAVSSKMEPSPVKQQVIPHELLVSLTSTVCNRSTPGQTAHRRHCEGCGIRRPDAVWHHPLGRKKYKYFLEQPTTLTGAGRDISFLCDAMVTQKKTTPLPPVTDKNSNGDTQNLSISESLIPEEYHIVKNKGIRSLEFYEDAFTVQLKDDEQKLRVLPSLNPSGRLEVVQLMRMMDDMLKKAGVDQQSEELTELSQLESLLELVKVEQNIYNIVFHELIRQVSVGCAERGQLLAKLRQRYQSLLDRIPHRLKALHTEAVAQRALDRRLTEEIRRIKTSIQQLSTELSKIRNHDAFVSHQAELANRQLAEALKQTHTNSDVVQGYHELYELQRARLEAQLLQMTEDRDCWSQLTFCLALKVISVKKLQLVRQLHIIEQSWFKIAEHCILYLTSKDTENLKNVMLLTDSWKEQLIALMSQLKQIEHAQCAQISTTQQGISKWLSFCTSENKSTDAIYEKTSVEELHADLKQWSNMLALQCEHYQGEKQLCCQQTLRELYSLQEKWVNTSLQLFKRHTSPDGEPPGGQQALRQLDKILSELLKQLETQVSGENGVHRRITSLLGLIESWVSKVAAVNGWPEKMSVSDWLKLEKALHDCQSLAEEALQSIMQTENKPDIYTETENVLGKVHGFVTSLSNFTEGENQTLHEEVSSVHMAQTRWMLDLLILMVPDQNEKENEEQDNHYAAKISLPTLDEDARTLTGKLDYFSSYISSSCTLIVEQQVVPNLRDAEDENVMTECKNLQRECVDWVETCMILLSGVHDRPKELPVKQSVATFNSNAQVSPADSIDNHVNEEASADSEVKDIKDESETELREGELTVCESPVVRLIGYDGNITERKLGESSVQLNETDEQVVSPVTEETQKAFSDLTTVGLLQHELHDSEMRVKTAEERALKAEDALQAALEKIKDLERQLQGRSSLEAKTNEEEKKPPPSSLPVAAPAPAKETTAESKPRSSTKKTKKR
ncbi:axonemal dynein light chain domain-containing protein 1 isoform X2 [Acanthochromis polyacanthus]|uniref:Axonemal dynein light chain domain containing 1 n=1 Tax=Acanthochromis polyacanthus TaxID=80966 RepID=A0A3Q1FUL5_9TELE|nr:axonemal dynein light chain domain-containing protein 1 isoform X2 [Acanthochromis polyacanthus]